MKHSLLFLLLAIYPSPSMDAQENLLEKPMVIVIPSYNNSKWCDWNLSSVFKQNYSNYRVIYIDDCSDDGTYDLVIEKIKQSGMQDRVQVIRNNENKGALANIHTACHAADDDEIIVTLDGDDAFIDDPNVLKTINDAYQNPNVWITYGQYREYPGDWLGICHAIPDYVISSNTYRDYPWVTSHVRTYYAWLFKRIKKEDLLYKNLFYSATADLAIMFPMLEMSGGRFKFIDQVLYIHNNANPLNDFKLRRNTQAFFEKIIRGAQPYQPLLPIIVKGDQKRRRHAA